jgi:hypothetical protein
MLGRLQLAGHQPGAGSRCQPDSFAEPGTREPPWVRTLLLSSGRIDPQVIAPLQPAVGDTVTQDLRSRGVAERTEGVQIHRYSISVEATERELRLCSFALLPPDPPDRRRLLQQVVDGLDATASRPSRLASE